MTTLNEIREYMINFRNLESNNLKIAEIAIKAQTTEIEVRDFCWKMIMLGQKYENLFKENPTPNFPIHTMILEQEANSLVKKHSNIVDVLNELHLATYGWTSINLII